MDIIKLLEERGIKEPDLIRAVTKKTNIDGKDRTNFHRYLRGKVRIPQDILKEIANFLDVTTDYLIGRTDEPTESIRKIPIIGTASCGVPSISYITEYPDEFTEETHTTSKSPHVYAIKAVGDSMETYLHDGDVCIFIDPNGWSESIQDGEIVHYTYEGESGIKVYKIKPKTGQPYLKPLNSAYENIDIEYPELLHLSKLFEINRKARRF